MKSEDKNITTKIEDTILELTDYLRQLRNGKIHNLSKYSLSSQNRQVGEILLQKEIESVTKAIVQLRATQTLISKCAIADHQFHYDFDGTLQCD